MAALNAQLLQQQDSGASADFSNQSLPPLDSGQVQSLQQALQNDVQQSLSGGASGGLSQLDGSLSNTLKQFGFSQNQVDSFLQKLNQAASGSGHARHGRHARQVVNNLVQTLASNASSSSSAGAAGSLTSFAAPPSSAAGGGPSTSGATLDVSA